MLAWILFILYLIFTTYLGILGSKKTSDFSSFAIGDGKMAPWMVGITLAASTASAATFIVNPGFVYVHGLAAFMHLGLSVFIGIVFMLLLASYKFRRIGKHLNAVTIPGWIGKRYNSKPFAIFFSLVNLMSFAFLVLLVGGISIVMQKLLGISNLSALLITLVFVTSYVIIGGTYAHVYTNLLQGSLMIIVSIIVFGSGLYLVMNQPDIWSQIANKDPNLLRLTNPDSTLYSDLFSVYISGFLIGAALVCQPHILTKALYVDSDKSVTRYIIVFAIVYFIFTLLLLTGFWALIQVPEQNLIEASTGNFRQDLVMTEYLNIMFPEWLFTFISIVLLAAAMSTLDGLMVGLSTITSNDFWMNIRSKKTGDKDLQKEAHKVSHLVLVILAILTFAVTLNPPELLGVFGQVGVYALVLTSLPAIVNGIFFQEPSVKIIWPASVLAFAIYIILYWKGADIFGHITSFANPAVPAGIAILLTSLPAFLIQLSKEKKYSHG